MRASLLLLLALSVSEHVELLAAFTSLGFRQDLPWFPCGSQRLSACDRDIRCTLEPAFSRGRRTGRAVPFLPKRNHPTSFNEDPRFAYFKVCNSPELADRMGVGVRNRIGRSLTDLLDELGDQSAGATLARELARDEALDTKEFFEAFEFYERVRKRVRQPVVVDLACGHGFCGLLFAALERSVDRVVLVDRRRPRSFDTIFAAVQRVAPWVASKVSFLEADLQTLPQSAHAWHLRLADLPLAEPPEPPHSPAPSEQPPTPRTSLGAPSALATDAGAGVGFLALHACGLATDACIGVAASTRGPLAAMPCCYSGCGSGAPYGVRRALGKSLAADIDRSYRLEGLGYHVDWSAIPRAITPMNRILIATPRAAPSPRR